MDVAPLIVLDTHTLVWTVEGDGRLGTGASRLIEETVQTDRLTLQRERGRWNISFAVGYETVSDRIVTE